MLKTGLRENVREREVKRGRREGGGSRVGEAEKVYKDRVIN